MTDTPNFRSVNLTPPQNIEVEEAILGGILLDPEGISRVSDKLIPEAFYTAVHADIYKAALALHGEGKPTDLIAMTDWLTDQDRLKKIGGQAKLIQLLDRTVSAVNIDSLAVLVMDKYIRRELIKAGNEVTQLGYAADRPLEVVLDESEQQILNLTQSRPKIGLTPIKEIVATTYQDIQDRHDNIVPPGLTSDFSDLDGMTSGFQRSDLIIIAGRPSMGKCLAYDAEIVLADGSIQTIEQLYHQQQADILTLNNNWRFSWTQPSVYVDDGIKPVFRMRTRLGRSIETTITHPFLTLDGWRSLSQLQVGDKIAVPRIIPVFGSKIIREYDIQLFVDFALNYRVVPGFIFTLQKRSVALFIKYLFKKSNPDSSVCDRVDGSHLKFVTISEKLAHQVQHLLSRFSIIAQLVTTIVSQHRSFDEYKQEPLSTYRLDITEARSISIFISEIEILEREKVVGTLLIDCQKPKLSDNDIPDFFSERDAARTEKSGICPHKSGEGDNQIYWDEIVEIEFTGDKQVYDLTIPETHNFVANDICVHNTAISLNIAYNMAKLHQLPILVFSLEMSKDQLVQRLIASEAGVDSSRLRAGRISPNEWDPVLKAVDRISELPIFIDDNASMTMMEMRSQARKLQAENGGKLGLIMIDYLQLMEGGGDNRVQEISKITRSLKGLARELQVPLIALSQLSRSVEARNNKRPMMSDLRESGSIEQDADLIIMLYRDAYYNPDTPDRDITELIITKHRNGPTGVVKLVFDPALTKFKNLARPMH
jgi:replicative DNA helicase